MGKRAFPQSVQAPRSIGSTTAPAGPESPASKIRKKSSIQAGTASIALANRAAASATAGYANLGRRPRGRRRRRAAAAVARAATWS